MTSSADRRVDHDLGSRLGELCHALGGLTRRAERTLGQWIAEPDLDPQALSVAAEALAKMQAELQQAGETFAWVEEALDERAVTSADDGPQA